MPYNLSTMQSIFCNNKEITEIRCNGSLVYQKQSGPDYTEPFYVENITNSKETMHIMKYGNTAPTLTIEYSTDKSQWTQFENPTSTTAITLDLQPGDKVYLRCNTNAWRDGNYYNKIQGISKIGGNIMSLLYGSNFTGEETSFPSESTYNFSRLFTSNTNLINASKLLLPATTLTEYCYQGMFYDCTSLVSTPEFPATTLSKHCYENLFYGCTSLTQAPALPATTLNNDCYAFMFQNCTSLTQAPALPATRLQAACYSYMFIGCTALVQPPVLPASKLPSNCYKSMFKDCTSLNKITCYATSQIGWYDSLEDWLSNTSSTGTFTKAAGVTWPTGTSGIPEGWTVVEA